MLLVATIDNIKYFPLNVKLFFLYRRETRPSLAGGDTYQTRRRPGVREAALNRGVLSPFDNIVLKHLVDS